MRIIQCIGGPKDGQELGVADQKIMDLVISTGLHPGYGAEGEHPGWYYWDAKTERLIWHQDEDEEQK